MNTLSWLIYLASVVPNISKFLFLFGFMGIFIILSIALISRDPEICQKPYFFKKTLIFCFSIVFLSTFIPSKETIYMIAASEYSEKMMQTQEAKDVLIIISNEIKKMKENSK